MQEQEDSETHRESFDQYQDMIMMANDGIIVVQEEKIILVNPALLRMLGYDEGELIGKPVGTLLDIASAHFYQEAQESAHWGEVDRPSFRACLQIKNGQTLNVEIRTSYFIVSGLPATLGIVRDISDQIELEAAIDASESRYRALFDSSPIAYFTLSVRGNILQINKAAEYLLGYNGDDLLRRNLSTFIHGDNQNEIVNQIVSEVAQGKSLEDFEMQFQRSDGRATWVSVTANRLEYPDKSSNIALMAIDIDRRKNAEAREYHERERANLYLEVMTHDLNNINQSLLFSLGLVETSPDIPDNFQSMMQQASWHIRRSARMTANMRALLRLSESPPIAEEVDIFDYIQMAKFAVEQDFPWKKLSLKTNIQKGQFKIAGHEYVHHICFNIIHNAMTFDEKNPVEIEVNAETIKNLKMVRLEFTDKGPGVPDATKEFIFRRTGSPDDQMVGRGLGLTLVDQIVRNLGGRIRVEDHIKGDSTQGARFVIMFPMWVETKDLPCGRTTCITFYKSNHCVFCEPAFETMMSVLDELSVPRSIVELVNVDDPSTEVDRSSLPMVPLIKICNHELTGFITEESIRTAVLNLAMRSCYPDFL
ncbi:PAS domain-containing sensor histidine kinase [Candidatus Thorarchaeota archaeon]|nr:MAG: PAS domain-containing sensor histidine kinase [Candidatus Thorarchaeota archaeon]